jgi:magnesium chelatase family protein
VAKRIPTILPALSWEENIEISKIYSLCGLLPKGQPLLSQRPFRCPHHTITMQGLVGGGLIPKPGEISLAHKGVLFLDELPEFKQNTIEILRQPMEEKEVRLVRVNGTYEYPADFILVAAMNPCKCGFFPDLGKCRCTPTQIRRYLNRVSGPFLDRIDIGVEVPRQDLGMMAAEKSIDEGSFPQTEQRNSSAVMRARVMEARARQEKRFADESISYNSQMTRRQIEEYCRLSGEEAVFLEKVERQQGISARGHGKILKVARTLTNLNKQTEIGRTQLAEAIGFRSFEKKYWGSL